MKAKRLLSLFLTLLMVVSTFATIAISVSATEAVSVAIKSVELKGWAKDNKGTNITLAGTTNIGKLYNGDLDHGTGAADEVLTTCYAKGAEYLKTSRFNNGVYSYSQTEDYADGYFGVLFVELVNLCNVETFNLWCSEGYAEQWPAWVTNEAYDIWYSEDGVNYTTNDNLKFSGMATSTDYNHDYYKSAKFTKVGGEQQDAVVHAIDMGGVDAKYIAIAVKGTVPATTQNEMVFHEISVEGTTIGVFDATIASITNLGRRTKVGKNFSEMITYTNNDVLDKAFDGDFATSACSNNLSQDYTPSVVFDQQGNKFVAQNPSYHDVIIIKLTEKVAINDLTVWGDTDKTSSGFMSDNFTIFYSVDGETYTYLDRRTNMSGDSLGHEGDNAYLASEQKTVGTTTYYGTKFDMKGTEAAYIAIAVDKLAKNGRVMLNEITFTGKDNASVTIESMSNMGRRTKAGKNFETDLITYTNDNALTSAYDGDVATYACSNGLSQDYTPSVMYEAKTGKFAATQNLVGGPNFYDVLVIKLTAFSMISNMTVWGESDKNRTSFLNDAFDVYYSADGATFTYVDGVNNMRGDGFNPGANADLAYYTHKVENTTYYGVNFNLNNVTAGYVAIAVARPTGLDNRIMLSEVTFNDTVQTPPSTGEGDKPSESNQMGIGIQSVTMPWISFDALVGAEADKELCAGKMFDGFVDTDTVWRNNDRYDPSEQQIAEGKQKLAYVKSMVDGKMVDFDGEASDNDFYDYIIMDLSNDTENKTYDVSVFRWFVGSEPTHISNGYSVYVSADGETWTLCESFDEMFVGYGPVYKYDKTSERLYHDISIDQDDVRYVMLTIEQGRADKDFLMYNVCELVVYEKGTEPKEEPKQENNNTNNNNNSSNPKPIPKPADTSADDTQADETTEAVEEKKGCVGSIGMGAVAVVAITGAAVTFARKRKED